MALLIRRGTDAERQQTVFAEGELVYTTDTKRVYIGDNLTPGGIFAGGTSSIINDTTPQLGGNLDLNAFEITGVGEIDIVGSISADTITAGAFIGDGSGLTNLPTINGTGEGVVEGSTYRIDIAGDDSTIILNSSTRTINASAVNALTIGASTATINSTLTVNNSLRVGDNDSLLFYQVQTKQSRAAAYKDVILNAGNQGFIDVTRTSSGTIEIPASVSNNSSLYSMVIQGHDGTSFKNSGVMSFAVDGNVSTDVVPCEFFVSLADTNGQINFTKGIHYTSNQRVGIMTNTPGAELDVDGNTIIRGTVTASGFIQFGSYTDLEISTIIPSNGMVYYNTTDNRFRGYQNGIWINLDDGSVA